MVTKKTGTTKTTKNVDTTKEPGKENTGQKEPILSVSEMAKKLGIEPKRLRIFLRAEYPRNVKGKKWEITAELAKKIEKDYKAKVQPQQAKKVENATKENEKTESQVKEAVKPEIKDLKTGGGSGI